MKYLLGIVSVIGLALMILIAWNNPSANILLSIPFIHLKIYTTSFVYVTLMSVCAFIAGAIFMGAFLVAQKDKINPYKRQLEKMSVKNDSDSSRVAVLEAKIKTLEAALQKSLDK